MANESVVSRRQFLGRGIVGLSVLAAGASVLGACGGGEKALDCANPPVLAEPQKAQRTSLAYVDHAADPNKQCQKCQFFQPAQAANTCGGCALNLGPVNPQGSCNSFAPKA